MVSNCERLLILLFGLVFFNNVRANVIKSFEPGLKIAGGHVATPHMLPSMVRIEAYTRTEVTLCGGTLISPDTVLTAAHCIIGRFQAKLLFGGHDINRQNASESFWMTASDFIIHPNYIPPGNQIPDIALIKLPKSVTLNQFVQIIGLATKREDYSDSIIRVFGWGRTEKGYRSDVLKYADNRVLASYICRGGPDMICVSGDDLNEQFCSGDSGGPGVLNGIQIGIIQGTISESCPDPTPDYLVRVSSYIDWIQQHTQINQ